MGIKEERVLVVDPKAQAVERLLKRLSVAIKTFGLYPQQHPVAERALQGLLASLRPYLEAYGSFVARITKQSFVVDTVTFDNEAYTNLALHLYTRKVAVFTVLPAVTDQELGSFLSVAGMDRVSLETAGGVEHLLWQSAVGNVQIIELTLDQEQDVEALGLNAFLALIGRGRLAPREREAVIDILYAADHTARLLQNIYLMSAEVFEGLAEEDRIEHAYQAVRTLDRIILDEPLEGQPLLYANLAEALLLVEEPLRSALPLTFVSRAGEDTSAKYLLSHISGEHLAEMIARGSAGPDVAAQVARLLATLSLSERKAQAVLSLLETRLRPPGAAPTWLSDAVRPHLPEPTDRQEELLDGADALAGHLSWMVDQQEFPLLAAALERLKRTAATTEGTRSTLAAGIVRRVTEHPLLDRLLAALWAGRETRVEQEGRAGLEVLAGDAGIPLVRVLGGEPRAGMRAILCDLLVGIGRDYVRELAGFIADDRWYLVRNIANILGRLQSPEVAVHLERVIDHPEYRVRREVADALARLGTEEAQSLLIRLLDDNDQRIQLRALQALNAWGTRRALQKLLALVEGPDPLNRFFALKAGALEALERLGAPEALPVLKRLARSPIAIGQHRRELRDLARRAVLAIEGQVPEERRAPTAQAP